jgi:4-oxalocrotonate tautomerase
LPVKREDVNIIFEETTDDNTAVGGVFHSNPIIHMELLLGRTQEQKRQLATAFTDAMVRLASTPTHPVKREDVIVIFVENLKENSATGAVLHSDE